MAGKEAKRYLKIEKIARLSAAGFPDSEIAKHLGCHLVYVSMLRKTKEYPAIYLQMQTGVVSEYDRKFHNYTENSLVELRNLVPTAMQALSDALLDKTNPKIRFEAAKEILDREGTMAKVSRTQVTHKEEFDFTRHDVVASNLLEALQMNTSSNNSTSTSDSIAGEFVKAGLSQDAQAELHKFVDLETFDVPDDAKIN